MNVLLIQFRIDNTYTSDLTAISTCLVIGVKLGTTYQYRGKNYDMSTLTGRQVVVQMSTNVNRGRQVVNNWQNLQTQFVNDPLQWNWNSWPAIQTLELKYDPLTVSRETIQNAIEKLSLKHCPPSLEEVIFNFDLTPSQSYSKSYRQSLLKYKLYTDQYFGLEQELDSIQKWNKYESYMQGWTMGMITYTLYRGPVHL